MCYTTRTWSLKFHGNEFETIEIIINVVIIVVLKSFLTVLNINPYYLTPRFFLIRTIGSCDVTCSIYFLSPQSGKDYKLFAFRECLEIRQSFFLLEQYVFPKVFNDPCFLVNAVFCTAIASLCGCW